MSTEEVEAVRPDRCYLGIDNNVLRPHDFDARSPFPDLGERGTRRRGKDDKGFPKRPGWR